MVSRRQYTGLLSGVDVSGKAWEEGQRNEKSVSFGKWGTPTQETQTQ